MSNGPERLFVLCYRSWYHNSLLCRSSGHLSISSSTRALYTTHMAPLRGSRLAVQKGSDHSAYLQPSSIYGTGGPAIPKSLPVSADYVFKVGDTGYTASLFVNPAVHTAPLSQPSNIFLRTPIRVPFSNAAATLSLSPSCRLTCSAVLCVPSLILTSTRNLGGRACSSLTRTPKPMTVAREQWVMVGVMRTVSVVSGDDGPFSGNVGFREISGRLTTESDPRVRGCSGSEMVEIRSA